MEFLQIYLEITCNVAQKQRDASGFWNTNFGGIIINMDYLKCWITG